MLLGNPRKIQIQSTLYSLPCVIVVAPITQLRRCVIRVVTNYKELLIKERIHSLWEQILSLKRSSHFERCAIEENHCLIQESPFGVRNFFSVLAMTLDTLEKYKFKTSKGVKIRNKYNQVPHLTQDTNGKVTNSRLDTTKESQEVSPFPAGDHKAHINRRIQRHSKHKTEKHKRSTKEVPPWNGQ